MAASFPVKCSLLVAAVAIPTADAVAMRQGTRIINGTVVKSSSVLHAEFALPTSGVDSDTWLGCGASIISPTYALTSAHCFGGGHDPCSGPSQLMLWMGDVQLDTMENKVIPGSGKSFRVQADVVCSEKFDGKCSHGNDIALLKLKEPVPDWVKPITLNFESRVAENDVVSPIGYGMTEGSLDKTTIADVSATLRKANVQVLAQDNERCKHVYSGGYGCSDESSEAPAENYDMQLCAGVLQEPDEDACAGDSGSPVLDAAGRQVGIVSYGGGPGEKRSGEGRMCGDPNFPGVYAQVFAFKDFITAHVTDLPKRVNDEGAEAGDQNLRR